MLKIEAHYRGRVPGGRGRDRSGSGDRIPAGRFGAAEGMRWRHRIRGGISKGKKKRKKKEKKKTKKRGFGRREEKRGLVEEKKKREGR